MRPRPRRPRAGLRGRSALSFIGENGILASMLVTIDKAGRVVIPKDVRDRLGLAPDTAIDIEVEGQSIRLTPQAGARRQFEIVGGWPVFKAVDGHVITDIDVQRLRDADQR